MTKSASAVFLFLLSILCWNSFFLPFFLWLPIWSQTVFNAWLKFKFSRTFPTCKRPLWFFQDFVLLLPPGIDIETASIHTYIHTPTHTHSHKLTHPQTHNTDIHTYYLPRRRDRYQAWCDTFRGKNTAQGRGTETVSIHTHTHTHTLTHTHTHTHTHTNTLTHNTDTHTNKQTNTHTSLTQAER